jgi:hypothetical protein
MRVTTIDQATGAVSALLRGGDESVGLLRALEVADRRVLIDAAAGLLVAEARVAVDAKGWSVPDARAAASKKGFFGPSRTTIEAALVDPAEVPVRLRSGWRERFDLFVDVLRMLGFLQRLPTLPPTHPPQVGADRDQTGLHGKVRALLAKAESTPFEAEAAACTAKAQELMARYAIDEATVRRDAATATATATTSMRVIVEAPYVRPKVILLSVVARNNRSRSVWLDDYGFATVFGASNDLWAVDLLYTSLLVQAAVALRAERERSRSFRHAFLLAFAHRIGERLREGTASAVAAASTSSGNAFLPVLAAREEAAEAARDAAFPRTTSMRVSMSNGSGAHAGRAAADAASITRDGALPRRGPRAVGR